MDLLAGPDRVLLRLGAPSGLCTSVSRGAAGERPHLVRGAPGSDRTCPVSDRHCHGRRLSESLRLGRVLIPWTRQVTGQAHIAPLSCLGGTRKSHPSPGHRRGTDSRHQAALDGHGRTPKRGNLSSDGHLVSRRDTRGHATNTVRDREAPGSNPGPPTKKSYSNRGLRLLRLARGGHREVTDFLGTRWRQPRPSGFRTVN